MPIHLNLLAETQAADELRRRDPVKRMIFSGVLVVALIFVWWSWLQLRVMVASSNLSRVEAQIQSQTNAYKVVLVNEQKIADAKANLAALQKLANSRFLQGNLLNALQHATVPGVHLLQLAVRQSYFTTSSGNPQTNGPVTEKIVVSLDAQDFSSDPGEEVNRFKDAISREPYFKAALGKTNVVRLTNLSAPQVDSAGKPSVQFTLQCAYPDRIR
jgi:hypothetical protein